MKVILKRSVENLGESGEVVSVKPGYARNYLLPQGLAYEASEANLRRVEEERKASEERARRDYLEGRRQLSQLEGTVLEFTARASEEGRLFGSISAGDIQERLNALALDFEVDRRQVILEEPLKDIGEHRVSIRLHRDVETEIEVRVAREED
jgi:large subunit ribosomal protein L9